MNSKNNTYKYNNKIFSFYYFVEGYLQGIPFLVFPPYLAQVLGGSYDIALWLVVYFIGNLPWAIKMIVGLFNDKWGSQKYGRRFPWISGFGIFGAIWWFGMAFYLPIDQSIYMWFAIYYFFTQIGAAFSDTALDGLILDVTPKKDLGKVQGFTWALMLLGMGAGGMLLGLIFLALNAIPILFILTGILAIIASCLPYLIEEAPFANVTLKNMARDLISIVSKIRNYKVFGYTFLGAVTGQVILTFFNYVILIAIKVIDVKETILSITSGTAVSLLGWSSVFYFCNGLGTVIGSLIAGKLADKSRRKAVLLNYLIYMPFCLVSILPFILSGAYLLALIYGLLGQVMFGAIQGWMVVANQTVRGDLTNKYYPELKSTYFALLVSFSNLGQSFGTIMGAVVFSVLAGIITDFNIMYFILTLFCTGTLVFSFLLFKTINPKDYEFDHLTGEAEEKVHFT